MNGVGVTAEQHPWSHRRWVVGVLVILAGQLGLIFWLGTAKPPVLPSLSFGPQIYLPANPRAEWPALSNPALFVLANRRGFSGEAWLRFQLPNYDLEAWTEPPRPLALAVAQLGNDLTNYLRANPPDAFQLSAKPEPQFDVVVPDENLGVAQSTLTIEGEIARRRLLSQFQLPAWPATDVLTNSDVLVGVDARGDVVSSVLVEPKGSGSRDADAAALKLAGSARFQPLRWNGPGQMPEAEARLRWGRMIFHWHTVPMPVTNAPAGSL